MFAYLKGRLADVTPSYVILDIHGVGYKVFVPVSLFDKVPPVGEELLLYTSFIIRENAQSLFGFVTNAERDLFETLLTVSGIGPKTANAMIGHLPLHDLQKAISNGDIRTITKVPGIGKRIAERLVVELRDKLPALFPRDLLCAQNVGINAREPDIIRDAMSALINLGYNQNMAQKAIKTSMESLPEDVELPVLITTALKVIR